ncbi:MAG TPA: GGDEF domain-containing protein [Ideonella sp.]|uniref:GGDEF domain-containing protein n=1 Tax=Ideonella sp. TaxID=1929293 RepID=UPI002E37CFC5|nr:GGDEF domain-containing protein [Ideonella sp.]HEX5683978.1 GGDEF domain-containing protein [Ideonella sp.]
MLLLFGLSSRADVTEDIERQVQSDPHRVLSEAKSRPSASPAAQDLPVQLRLLRMQVMAQVILSETDGELIETGLTLARRLRDTEAECELQIAKGEHLFDANRAPEAEAAVKQAEELAAQAGLQRQVVRARYYLGMQYFGSGRTSEALALFVKALPLAEEIGDQFGAAAALNGMAAASFSPRSAAEDYKRSIELYRRALHTIEQDTYASFAVMVKHNLAMALKNSGDVPGARVEYASALELAQKMRHRLAEAMLSWRLAGLDLHDDRPQRALARLDVAEPFFDESNNLGMQFNVRLDRADALARLGNQQASLKMLASAEKLLPALKNARRELLYFEAAARIQARLQNMGEAYEAMLRVRVADKAAAVAANDALAAELRARFDAERKEKDNEVLRAKQLESEARRQVLLLALASAVLLLLGLATILHLQVRQKRRFATLALSDELTKLPNRRSMLDTAGRQLRGRREVSGAFHLALLDIDHFKRVNDQHGHDVGDWVLRAFAQACAPLVRGSDTLGRFGGEEFLLILPQCDANTVAAVFARLQKAVHAIRVPNIELGRELSFSMGVAAAGPDESLEALLKRADAALYAAKDAGRDRCLLAPGTGPHSDRALPAAAPRQGVPDEPAALTAIHPNELVQG